MLVDLKAENLCFGCDKNNEHQVYLVNFESLTHSMTRFLKSHGENMHKGSIQYISRDAHEVSHFNVNILVSLWNFHTFIRLMFISFKGSPNISCRHGKLCLFGAWMGWRSTSVEEIQFTGQSSAVKGLLHGKHWQFTQNNFFERAVSR